jgi:Cu/Ag efflux protein CusF
MVRKLALVAALAVPALAWSQTATDRNAKHERKEAASATQQQMKEKTDRAGDRMGANDANRNDKDRDQRKTAFDGKHNYDIDGKVAKVENDKLTIRRDDMPAATLDVNANTKVELDGDRASLSQLTPGQDVKASFNLEGDKPLAVEVKAKRTDAQKDQKKAREDQKKDERKNERSQTTGAPANR